MRHTTETEQPMERSWYCVHSPFATDSPTAPEQPTRSMPHATCGRHQALSKGGRTTDIVLDRMHGAQLWGRCGRRERSPGAEVGLLAAKVTSCHDRAKQEKIPLLAHLPRVDAACAAGVSQHGQR